MAITKICDGYYYGTQEDLKPLLLGGAEKDSVYCAIDTGAIYKGVKAGSSDSHPVYLSIIDRINRRDNNKVLVNPRDLTSANTNGTKQFLGGEKPFRYLEIPENLLVKNSKFTETDETNGYTRTGSLITHTNEQSTSVVKSLNVFADEVTTLAIGMVNLGDESLSSGAIKVGYIDNSGDTPEFVEVQSIGSCNAGASKSYRAKAISSSANPHYELAIQLNAAATVGLLIADEKYFAPYSDTVLTEGAKYDLLSNIIEVNDKSGKYDYSQNVKGFHTPDFMLNQSVLKAVAPVKVSDIADSRYSDTAGVGRKFLTGHEYGLCGRTAAAGAVFWNNAIMGIAEVEF